MNIRRHNYKRGIPNDHLFAAVTIANLKSAAANHLAFTNKVGTPLHFSSAGKWYSPKSTPPRFVISIFLQRIQLNCLPVFFFALSSKYLIQQSCQVYPAFQQLLVQDRNIMVVILVVQFLIRLCIIVNFFC